MTLEDALQVLAYNVFVMLQDAETGELIAIAYANTIKSNENMEQYMQMKVFQIIPVNTETLKITLTY